MRELPDSSAPERDNEYTIRAQTSTSPQGPRVWQRNAPRQTICSNATGQLVTAMARMAGGPTDTHILGFDVGILFCLGACKEFKLSFHHGR